MIFNTVPPTKNLTDYINDVKPFRTKLIDATTEYVIHDSVKVIISDFFNKDAPKTDSATTKLLDYFTVTEDSAAAFYAYYDISIGELIISNIAETYYVTHNGTPGTPVVIIKSIDTGIKQSLPVIMSGTADSPGVLTASSFKFSIPPGITVPFALSVILN